MRSRKSRAQNVRERAHSCAMAFEHCRHSTRHIVLGFVVPAFVRSAATGRTVTTTCQALLFSFPTQGVEADWQTQGFGQKGTDGSKGQIGRAFQVFDSSGPETIKWTSWYNARLFTCLFVFLSVCPVSSSIYLFIYLPIYLSIYRSMGVPVCLPIVLSIYLPTYTPVSSLIVSLFIRLPIFRSTHISSQILIMHACMHTWVRRHIHTWMHRYIDTCIHAYTHTHAYPRIHTYMIRQ